MSSDKKLGSDRGARPQKRPNMYLFQEANKRRGGGQGGGGQAACLYVYRERSRVSIRKLE